MSGILNQLVAFRTRTNDMGGLNFLIPPPVNEISRKSLNLQARRMIRLIVYTLNLAFFMMINVSFVSAAILYVDRNNSVCSDQGSGSQQTPFCTISAAAVVAGMGDTVFVESGNYQEMVAPRRSGTKDAPLIFTAADRADVRVTGGNNGFRISGLSWIVIKGFTISDTTSVGIYVKNSTNIKILKNHVTKSGKPLYDQDAIGIYLNSGIDSVVSGNIVNYNTNSGIYLAYSATRNEIIGNVSHHNAMEYTRKAAGIDIRTLGNNIIKDNICYSNEDSGIQIRTDSVNNLIVNNLCYDNGDHGIDVLYAPGQTIISNSIYRNVTSGINVEGSSTNCKLVNNISVDNAINSPRSLGNIRIDNTSVKDTTLDYDIVYMSEPGWWMILWNGIGYRKLSDFVNATGMETHGIEANPLWVDPDNGDFHLKSGSPAIDSADSGESDILYLKYDHRTESSSR
jgi:parallel beta-helix repeat protein